MRTWEDFRLVKHPASPTLTSTKADGSEEVFRCWLLDAKRSDGVKIAVAIPLAEKLFDGYDHMDYILMSLMNALLTLETFRDCECTPEKPCDIWHHQKPKNE